ncbi:hypothetical protein ACFPOB_15940 [Bosea eneae]|uniref:Uncharacterized protein n=1 Tax=Bosea eneae TaxID=151454 RepID=A0ABW0IS61_9HYPH
MPSAPDQSSGKVARIPRRRMTVRRRASIRMAELYRLAIFRHQFGVSLSPDQWAFALAATLASAPAEKVRYGKRGQSYQWHGLDGASLFYWIEECRLGRFSLEEVTTIMAAVERWRERNGFTLIRSDVLARMLSVTAEERWLCRITTIGAIDETAQEREARARTDKNTRERERNRTKRAGKHKPRAVYLDQSLSARKPWEVEGISRATWYRRQRETSVLPCVSIDKGTATNLSHEPERPANTDEAAA